MTVRTNLKTASAALTLQPYHLGFENLVLGQRIVPTTTATMYSGEHVTQRTPENYHPAPGIYVPRELVKITAPLLESIVLRLGPDGPDEVKSSRDILLDGLAASLATTGRESTLPLSYSHQDTSRKEIAWQAHRIGKSLVKYVREVSNAQDADANYNLYSQCEGHLWTPEVAALLMGPRSNSQLMALYNEWLHRMILLRDALLPFENYAEVPFVIPYSSRRGIRDFEQARKVFLLHCLAGTVPQNAIIDLAKVFTAPTLPAGGYGLQYSQGLILPAFLSGSNFLHLVRHHPARLDDSKLDLLFDYEHPVYSAARTEICEPEHQVPPGAWPPPSLMALDPHVRKSSIGVDIGKDASRRLLKLELDIDAGVSISVDLGQIARGRRYAYRASPNVRISNGIVEDPRDSNSDSSFPESTIQTPSPSPPPSRKRQLSNTLLHRTVTALSHPGLVSCSKTGETHVFPASDPLIGMALLGKLYPENVILLDDDGTPEDAESTGKGFGARFVVLQKGKRRKVTDLDD
jgi:hypothetical protein